MIQLSQLAFLYNRIKGQYFLAVNPSLIIKKKSLVFSRVWKYKSADAPIFDEQSYEIAKDLVLKVGH